LFFSLLRGLHDVGKATPAFQMKDEALAGRVRAEGLGWRALSPEQGRRWHHALAGAAIMRTAAEEAGWPPRVRQWVWPLIAGHHGVVPRP
jgi:CRISPR-associated endonuclease/helicase Cas3